MSFKENFCPSPWFHMRIDQNGSYHFCRWKDRQTEEKNFNIQNTTTTEYFQNSLADLRMQMLNGEEVKGCAQCKIMESQGKVSGRQKQLLKTGIQSNKFLSTLQSSPFFETFKKTAEQHGRVPLEPQDWQIDLGNFCNSACIFCAPTSSSKMATEFKKLGLINDMPKKNWADNPILLKNFIKVLTQSKKISYLHFLGGETLITPAFKTMLTALIDAGMHKNVSIGFTTNLTVWPQKVIDLLVQYKEVNLGMSIECLHQVNDYLRWPSKIDQVKIVLEKWLDLAKKHNWLIQIRSTPTILSIAHLKELYEYAFVKNIGIESCNFLYNPKFMKISLLPNDFRNQIIKELEAWIRSHNNFLTEQNIINTRDQNNVRKYILQDAQSYVNYLKNIPHEPDLWKDLVDYVKKLESSRRNSILDYAPEYEKLLRAAGY